jgi:hypothetical protein
VHVSMKGHFIFLNYPWRIPLFEHERSRSELKSNDATTFTHSSVNSSLRRVNSGSQLLTIGNCMWLPYFGGRSVRLTREVMAVATERG